MLIISILVFYYFSISETNKVLIYLNNVAFLKNSKQRAKAEHLIEKGNAMILSCENSPQATGAVRTCAHTNTTVIRKESRRTDFRKLSDMTPP